MNTIKSTNQFFIPIFLLTILLNIFIGCNKESDKSKNNLSNKPTQFADLSVSGFTSDTNIQTGDNASVSFTIKNTGEVEASGFNVGIYLSTDRTVTKEDTLWTAILACSYNDFLCQNGSESLSLEANGKREVRTSLLKLPDSINVGTWYAGVIVDTNNSVAESDETNNLSSIIEINITDITAPTVKSINQSTNSVINISQGIEIIFSESMDTSSLSIGGSMASEADTIVWSKVNYENDKLSISSLTDWTEGDNRTLIIDCKDKAGNDLAAYNLSYYVLAAIIYVKSDGNDSNIGSKDSPLKTISAAITKVSSMFSAGEVRVAEGTYDTIYSLNMREGISLFGGYSATDWNVRNPSLYTTTINYTGPFEAVDFSGAYNFTNNTVLDGFTINSTSDKTINLFDASPTISNNIINSSSSLSSNTIWCQSDISVKFENNTINGSASGEFTKAIMFSSLTNNSSPVLIGNTINGGSGTSFSTGVKLFSLSANNINFTFSNNTINGGSGQSRSIGIDLDSNSINVTNTTMSGNTINGGTSAKTYGIYIKSGNQLTLSNNTIDGGTASASSFSDSYGLYLYTGSSNVTSTISENSITGGTAQNNSYAIYFDSNASTNTTIIKDNNIIDGGNGSDTSSAIVMGGGSTTIIGNRVFGGGIDGTTNFSKGISDSSDNGLIANNIVNGGNGNESHGLYLFSALNTPSQAIINNTILGDNYSSNNYSVGIFIKDTSPTIENNIISTPTGTNKICLGENTSSADPLTIKNNNLFGCTIVFIDENTTALDLSGMEELSTSYSGNIAEDPSFFDADGVDDILTTFSDNDYHLQTGTPVNTRQGGLDHTSTITIDLEGTSRTATLSGSPTNDGAAGWSMGAYEKD